jgi:hypothetical protein
MRVVHATTGGTRRLASHFSNACALLNQQQLLPHGPSTKALMRRLKGQADAYYC